MTRLLPLAFPLAQLACMGHALYWAGTWHGALAFAGACVALSFGVHVTMHECVHQGYAGGVAAELAMSFLMGLPFDGYRFHHMNHHQHENGPEDYSTTWRGERPSTWWGYALAWPWQLVRLTVDMWRRGSAGEIPADFAARLKMQKRFLAAVVLALALAAPRVALAYLALVYVGWALISVHNYGQHPPVAGRASTSYRARWYNALFCANGLHYEHHARPGVPWDRLSEDPDAPLTDLPHLVAPLKGAR